MCPDENALVAMLEHALPPGRIRELEVHFGSCQRCCDMVAALAGSRSLAIGTPHLSPLDALVDDAPPLEGTVGDRYEVRSQIGRGGMGTVYLARDKTLDREVALKLHRRGSGDHRLQREALAMAKLAHQNVVSVFEIGTFEDRLYVAMEYVRGTTLRGWLAERRDWRSVLALLADVGAGLAAAHAAGLIHRDFKPENVLVGSDGRPRVSDFGLVRMGAMTQAPASDRAAASDTGVVGTPAYMAPEQFAGGTVDARCDQFAFAVVAWECLYGKRPFAGGTLATIQLAIEQREFQTTPRAGVPDRVRRVLERALAVEPDARFADMPALLGELRRAAAPRTRQHVLLAAGGAAVLIAAAVPAAYALSSARHDRECATEAAAVRGAYGDGERAALERGLVGTGSPLGKTAFERTSSVLERYRDALARATEATCNAPDAPNADARRACLTDRTSELVGLVDALGKPDPGVVMRASGAAWAIYEPEPCRDPQTHTAAPHTLGDRALLGRVDGLVETGRYADAIALAVPFAEDAHRRGERTTELAVLLALGRTYIAQDAAKEAMPVLHRALALAETLGRDLDAATALDYLAGMAGLTLHDYTAANRYADLAAAKLARLGDGNLVARGRLFATRAQLAMDDLKLAEAAPLIRQACETLEQGYGPDHPEVGQAYAIESQILRGLGKTDASLTASRRALAILGPALGDDHPVVAGAQLTLASVLIDAHGYDEARTLLASADAVFVRALGPDHTARAAVAGNLGGLEQLEKHWDAAIAAYRHALAILEKTEGPDSPSTSGAHRDVAKAMTLAGRLDDALAEQTRAIAILEHIGDDAQSRLRGALVELAQIQLARKHPAEARVAAERAMTLAKPEWTTPDELAETKQTLADARVAR